MAPGAESLLGEDAGPDVEPVRAVSVELQLLSSLHLLTVLGQDQEGIRRHRVQRHVLWKQQAQVNITEGPLEAEIVITMAEELDPGRSRHLTTG